MSARTLLMVRCRLTVLLVLALAAGGCGGSEWVVKPHVPWSRRVADSFVLRHPNAFTYDSLSPDLKWHYEQGLMLISLLEMWYHSGDTSYLVFVKKELDRYIEADGSVKTYKLADYNLDNIAPGKALLVMYRETRQEKYRRAADTLRRQLREQPRTYEGGFWHKKIYPYQMWLDGLFMAQPFYAMYSRMFDEPDAFDDIANQFLWIAQHTYDSTTGLYYHGWDESKQQRWADPVTGRSPSLWGRAIGWYIMAMVDVLDDIPTDHPKRNAIISIFRNLAMALLKYRDTKTALWYQVIDQGNQKGNYLEASASCMFAYAFAKGANRGYLDTSYLSEAERTFKGVMTHLVTIDERGFIDLHNVCRSAGLGGNPYRDGSFTYYVSEPRRTNDLKGYGPLVRAAIELERGGRLRW